MMHRQWIVLTIVILIYLPVSIDATILHVAIPSLTQALQLSSNEMLWVVDIYSLIMAGFILPMGALGDRIGFKRLMLLGAILFGVASTLAAFSTTAYMLIFSRAVLGIGAAMILPATLSALRHHFLDEKQRNYALGVWGTIGGGGAAFGPLVGGWILEHFAWGAIFLINIPIIIMSVLLILRYIPEQKIDKSQSLSFLQAVVLVSSILLIIYAMKTGMYQMSFTVLGILLLGLTLLGLFVRHQLNSTHPMIDFQLFRHPVIATSMLMVIFSMAALVGFELLLSQELQFVYHFSPFEAGLFLLPLMIAISVGGPFSSILMNRYSLRYVASIGLLMCALSFWGLAMTHFIEQSMQAKILMFALGISVEVAFLSSTAAIMSAVPAEKATAAGAIEGMGYELGAGLGVAFFGLLLSFFYSQSIVLPTDLPQEMLLGAERTIAEAVQVAQHLDERAAAQLIQAANQAFSHSHARVLGIAGWIFFITAFFVWLNLAPPKANSC